MLVDGYKNSAQSPDGAACKVRRDTLLCQLAPFADCDRPTPKVVHRFYISRRRIALDGARSVRQIGASRRG